MRTRISCGILWCVMNIVIVSTPSYSAVGENIPFLKVMIINQMYDYAVQLSEMQQQIMRYTRLLDIPTAVIPDVFTRARAEAEEYMQDMMDISNVLVDELLVMKDVVMNQVEDFTQKGYAFLSAQLDNYSQTLQTARDAFQSWSTEHIRIDNDSIAIMDDMMNETYSIVAQTQVTNYSLEVISNQLQQLTEILLMSEKIRIAEQSEQYMKEVQKKMEEQRIIDNFWNGHTSYYSDDILTKGIYD